VKRHALTVEEAAEILKEMGSGGSAGLDGGAELEVFDAAGQSVLLAPLARHVTLDDDRIIWIRPILGAYRLGGKDAPRYIFDLNVTRRRAMDALKIWREGEEIGFLLRSGELARVRPVSGGTRPDLERWDCFFYNVLDADEQLTIESLRHDP
jgi:hypothetical protein